MFAILLYSLCGCSAFPTVASPDGKEVSQDEGTNDTEPSSDTDYERIETMKGWSFQYNQGTDDYSLFFELLGGAGKTVSANVDVDIRIVNDNGEEVLAAAKSVTDDDFGYMKATLPEHGI